MRHEPWQRNRNKEEAALYTVAVATTLTWGGTVGPLWVSVVIMASSCNGIDLHARACSLLNDFSRYQQHARIHSFRRPARPGGRQTHADFIYLFFLDHVMTWQPNYSSANMRAPSVWHASRFAQDAENHAERGGSLTQFERDASPGALRFSSLLSSSRHAFWFRSCLISVNAVRLRR